LSEITEVGTLLVNVGAFVVSIGAFYLILRIAGLVDALKERVQK
jgi:hypothetical protein